MKLQDLQNIKWAECSACCESNNETKNLFWFEHANAVFEVLLYFIVSIKYSYNALIVHMNIYNIIMKLFLTYKAKSIFQVTKPGFLKAKTFIKKHG